LENSSISNQNDTKNNTNDIEMKNISEKIMINDNTKNKNKQDNVKSLKSLTTTNKNIITSSIPSQLNTNLLIVFEEVDILMEQDKGFWASVYNIMKSTKRPIMFTGNGM